MAHDPKRGHSALRRGRWSTPGAEYFLTVCTDDQPCGLGAREVTAPLTEGALRLESEGAWHVRTMSVMPDHLHFLVVLGETLPLSEVVRRFKGRHASLLQSQRLRWERGCFDHRLRDDEDRLPVFLYIFLNPYRANLLPHSERWPGYYCCPEDWRWFGPLTDHDCPMPEWLL
ncbi:MAG: transposase [Opitutae bacterium]|nr:transposase [Opitutae bacterium]